MFARTFPQIKCPADSTGDLILARAGLVQPRKRRRWVSDNFSRYLLLCQGLPNTKADPVIAHFEQLFSTYGMPWAIRSDNGSPFASTALGGISRLSKWWIDLGIRPERIKPAHPEQNGRHERMHRSLKAYLNTRLDQIQLDLDSLQQRLDVFRQEYNESRSHEGLERQTPQACYHSSSRSYTGKIVPYDYDEDVDIRQVRRSGEIKWQGDNYYLSQVLAKEKIAFKPYADGIWHIYYRFHFLGTFDAREKKIKPATQWHVQPDECK